MARSGVAWCPGGRVATNALRDLALRDSPRRLRSPFRHFPAQPPRRRRRLSCPGSTDSIRSDVSARCTHSAYRVRCAPPEWTRKQVFTRRLVRLTSAPRGRAASAGPSRPSTPRRAGGPGVQGAPIPCRAGVMPDGGRSRSVELMGRLSERQCGADRQAGSTRCVPEEIGPRDASCGERSARPPLQSSQTSLSGRARSYVIAARRIA